MSYCCGLKFVDMQELHTNYSAKQVALVASTIAVKAEAPNTPAEVVASASAANQLYGATLSQRLTHQVSHQVLLKEGDVTKANRRKERQGYAGGQP